MAETSMSSKVGALVIGGVLILGAFFIGNAFSGLSLFGGGEEYTDISQTVVEQVRNVAELTTVVVVESTTVRRGTDFGWLNWARGDEIFMFVVVEIGAGIDFEDFYTGSFEVDKETGSVSVRMPEAAITYVAVDNEQTQVINRTIGAFTRGDAQLESDARQVAESVLVENALNDGILDKAETNARNVIEGFLLELGYERVVFVDSAASS